MKPLFLTVIFVLIASVVGDIRAKDTRIEETAFQINCPGFTLIASPADGQLKLDRVQALAECLGDNASRVCTVQVVKLKRSGKI